MVNRGRLEPVFQETEELIAIFGKSIKTASLNAPRSKQLEN